MTLKVMKKNRACACHGFQTGVQCSFSICAQTFWCNYDEMYATNLVVTENYSMLSDNS